MSARPAPVTGRRAWVGAALVAVAVISGLWSLTTVIQAGPWRAICVASVLLMAAFTTAVRQRTRSRTAPSAWGLAVAVLVLGALYAGRGTTPSVPLPTPETVERFARLARSGITAIADGTIPMEPARGVELLLVTGALAAYLVVDLLVLGLGRAGLSGLVIVGLWVPAVVFERTPALGTLTIGGLAFLLLLVLTRPQPGTTSRAVRGEVGPALGAAAIVTVLAVVAGPVASAMPFYGSVVLPTTWGPGAGSGAGPLRLSTELDMRSSLAERSDRPVLTYTTDAADLGPLRMYTMVEFDGTGWGPGEVQGELVTSGGWLDASGAAGPAGETRTVSIEVGDLDQDRLPIPIGPRGIDVDGTWLWDPARDEVVGDGSTTRGLSYEVTVGPRELSPDTLRADTAVAVGPTSPYLTVPESDFGAETRALAEELTADATTTYDKALALQSFFRDIAAFRYDPQVPPAQTDDAVWDFLTERTGYCVQFATAMTIMARMLGIPARLATGFLPGRPNTAVSGQFVVTGRQAHAWPELYFAGAGWVRFEPTPAAQTGAPPLYADPFAGQPVGPNGLPIPTSSAAASAAPGASAPGAGGAAGDGRVTIGSASVPLSVAVGGGALLVLLLAAATVLLVRRRRRGRVVVPEGPEAWWQELQERLRRHGVTWSDATTPRQAADLVREEYRMRAHRDDEAAAALDRLVRAVEAERYSPAPTPAQDEELRAWVDAAERPFLAPAADELVGSGTRA